MSFMPDTNVYIWLFPLGILSVWLINMGVRKLIAKRKTIIESMVNNARAETQSLELWLCKSRTKTPRKSGTKKFVLMP